MSALLEQQHGLDRRVTGASVVISQIECLNERQADFAQSLLDPTRPVPPGLVGPGGEPSAHRFNVYRNNVLASLTRVLRAAFPVTARLVGEDFFAGMARAHVATKPPASPMLFAYGAEFPDFIASFEAVATLPYLCDVARIERAWIEAYHAAEAHAIAPVVFAGMEPDQLPDMRIALHPSLRIVRSIFPALAIWTTNMVDPLPCSVSLDAGAEDALILRAGADVEVSALLPGAADFLHALADGNSILDATNAAIAADRRFDLSANLSELIPAGIFVGLECTG